MWRGSAHYVCYKSPTSMCLSYVRAFTLQFKCEDSKLSGSNLQFRNVSFHSEWFNSPNWMWRGYECFVYSPIQNYSWIEVQLIGLPRRILVFTMFYGEIQISMWRVSLRKVKLSNLILHSSSICAYTLFIEYGERLSSLCVLKLSNFNGEW